MLDPSPELPRLTGARTLDLKAQPSALGPYDAGLAPVDGRALLRQFGKIVGKQKWKLVHFTGLALLLALIMQLAFPRLYQATAVLRLDRHSAAGAVGQEAAQMSTINDMDEIITTDIELAQSDTVVRPVAEKFHLVDYQKSASSWMRWFGVRPTDADIQRAKEAPVELSSLKVTRPPNTYLIRVTYRSWNDPQLAANVANGVADSLVRQVHLSLDQSYLDVSSAIRRDMEQLRSKMDISSRRLAQYEKDLKVVDPDQRSTILTTRLTQLLAEYTAAQADRLHKQAIAASITEAPAALAATQAIEDGRQRQSLLDESLGKLATARQQFVSARAYYGENHPEYRKAKQQLDEADAQVERFRVEANDKASAEYKQALGREFLLKRQFDRTKAEVDRLKTSSMAYAQLKSEAENDRKIYMDLETRTREADVNRQFHDATIQFINRARPPAKAIFPRLTVNLPIALLLAVVLGAVGALAADALDPTFSDGDDLASRMRLPVLATLPDAHRFLDGKEDAVASNAPVLAALAGVYNEEIRMLRNAIGLAGIDRNLKNLLITSGGPGEGKSTTAAQLAAACAQAGKKVLLVDADLRRPALHKKFQVHTALGLSDVLAHGVAPLDVIVGVNVPGLSLLAAGPSVANAADLISQGFQGMLNQVSRSFDLVIVDAPPILGLSETGHLAGMVDGVLVVAKAERTSARAMGETLTALHRSRAHVVGVVMNQAKGDRLKGFGYYYQRSKQEGA